MRATLLPELRALRERALAQRSDGGAAEVAARKEDFAAFFSLFRVAHCLLVTEGERQCSVMRSGLLSAAVRNGGSGEGAAVGARIRARRWGGAAARALQESPAAAALEPLQSDCV